LGGVARELNHERVIERAALPCHFEETGKRTFPCIGTCEGKGARKGMQETVDWNGFISLFGLAIGSGALIKMFQFSSQHGKYQLKVDTLWGVYLEASKARGAEFGAVRHASPYEIDLGWLGDQIERSHYIPDPEILAYFRELAMDPKCPDNDTDLFIAIEGKFGMRRLVQEAAGFGAPADAVAGIWVLCVRAAQRDGVDQVLRDIKVIP